MDLKTEDALQARYDDMRPAEIEEDFGAIRGLLWAATLTAAAVASGSILWWVFA